MDEPLDNEIHKTNAIYMPGLGFEATSGPIPLFRLGKAVGPVIWKTQRKIVRNYTAILIRITLTLWNTCTGLANRTDNIQKFIKISKKQIYKYIKQK